MQSIADSFSAILADAAPDGKIELVDTSGHFKPRESAAQPAPGSGGTLTRAAATTADRYRSASPAESLSLDLRGGDVWAWEKVISGTCRELDGDAAITIVVDGVAFPAERNGDRFWATVSLRPGDNTVQAIATSDVGSWASDIVIHSVRLVPRPTARVSATADIHGIRLDGSGSLPGEFDAAPISTYAWSLDPGTSGVPETFDAVLECATTGPLLTLPIPAADGEYSVRLDITDERGRHDAAAVLFVVEGGNTRIVDPFSERAAWTRGATIYGVVVRNVGPAGFQSVIDRMDELADLGIAAIWLAPITLSIEGGFGYEVTDYFGVRPEYGTLSDFRRLVDEAHARDIRVLLDVVPNHTSIEHPYCQDARVHGAHSNFHTFYERDENGGFTSYFDWTHLPNLDFDNPEVCRFMTEALMFWVREMDVDGFRLDAAWGIKQRQPDFWLQFNAEFKRVKPEGLLIAEASARDPFYSRNGFDAAYDWTGNLGEWAWTDVFSGDAPIPVAIRHALAESERASPDSVIFRFLNNNDTGPRFITTHGVELYRAALAMLLTLPGLPCLYTGDEVGAEFEPYAMTGPIDWEDRHGLRSDVRRLVHLRSQLPGLGAPHSTVLSVEPATQLLGYVRSERDGRSPVLVLINFSPEQVTAVLDPAEMAALVGDANQFSDAWTGTTIELGDAAAPAISMPAWGFRILVPAKTPERHNVPVALITATTTKPASATLPCEPQRSRTSRHLPASPNRPYRES